MAELAAVIVGISHNIVRFFQPSSMLVFYVILITLTHCGREDIFTILTSPKSWLSQEGLDAGCEHSLVPMDS